MKLAFLGLGEMGVRMARRLVDAGFDTVVWNRSAEKARAFPRMAASPAEAARGADLVLVCVTSTPVVEEVIFGAGGVAETIGPQTCVIDFSTINPIWARGADERIKARGGAGWIDAPVSGGAGGAEAGTLSIFLGGADDHIARAMPVFKALGQRITPFGGVGNGLVVKLCNQTIVISQLTAIAEAIGLAAHLGVDPVKVAEALKGGWADSTLLHLFGPRFAGVDMPPLGQITTMLKDADLILDAARAAGAPTPITTASAAVYRALADAGEGARDLAALSGPFKG